MSRVHSARLGEEDSGEYAGSNGESPVLAEILQSPKEGHYVLDVFESNPVRKSPNAFVLSFKNLTYSINPAGNIELPAIFRRKNKQSQEKLLLNDISGEAREGEILAVLGASGSGKSTFIDALANRITKESLKGTVNLNGEALESKLLKVISAYVMQDDLLYPMLTVEETLMFAAEFRLPRSLGKPKKRERVETLMDQLGLRRAAKTIIGDEGHRGISGGERRRVSIGIDIIHDPILLFLDEPTSGLDSTSAFLVIQVLKRIALSGSIVIMSIHQPSYRILGILDRMIFLSRGQAVFNDSPKNLQPFFSEFGHPIPENESHTEFALDMIRLHEASPGGVNCLVQFNQSWQKKKSESGLSDNFTWSLKEAIHARILSGKMIFESNPRLESFTNAPIRQGFANSFWNEMWALSKRSAINMYRAPEIFGLRLATVLITAFILSTIYWKLDETPKGVQERLGFFAFAISTTFYTCADALPVFLQERYIFVRETAYNAYRRSSYVIANSIVALPSLIILASAFSIVTFWAVGLAGGISGFFYYFFIVLASFWAGNSFVTFLSGIVGNVTMGYTAVVAGLAYYLLVSGFFINRDRIPSYWIWFHYLSVIKYPYEGVLKNEFLESVRCFATGSEIFDTTPLRGMGSDIKDTVLKGLSAAMNANVTGSTCMTTGIDILKQQSISGMSKWNCLIATVAWGFLFRAFFYLALLFGVKNKRM